jgi:hypothetical protein
MVGSKILVFFVSTLIVSVVSDDCFDYGTDYFGFDLGQDHLVSFMHSGTPAIKKETEILYFRKYFNQ